MLFPSPADAEFAAVISRLAYCNPFLPERIEFERDALGPEFVDADIVWNITQDWEGNRPNITKLRQRVEQVAADRGSGWWTGRNRPRRNCGSTRT